MATVRNGKLVTIESIHIPTKYRGPPNDPHFIPKSPILSRQRFTTQQETELQLACAALLAHIPHNDDMAAEQLRIKAHQTAKKQSGKSQGKHQAKREVKSDIKIDVKPETKTEVKNQRPHKDWEEWRREKRNSVMPAAVPKEQPVIVSCQPLVEESATPSDDSKNELGDSNPSTGITTPSYTPQEAPKVAPEPVVVRPSTAHPPKKPKAFRQSNIHTLLKDSGDIYSIYVTPAARSMTYLPSSQHEKPTTKAKLSQQHKNKTPKQPMSRSSENKSLPSLPRTTPLPKNIRTIRLVEPSKIDDRHFNPRQRASLTRVRTQPTPYMEPRCPSADHIKQLETVSSAPPLSTKKSKFDLTSIFARRKKD